MCANWKRRISWCLLEFPSAWFTARNGLTNRGCQGIFEGYAYPHLATNGHPFRSEAVAEDVAAAVDAVVAVEEGAVSPSASPRSRSPRVVAAVAAESGRSDRLVRFCVPPDAQPSLPVD